MRKIQVLDQDPVKDQNNAEKLEIMVDWTKRINYTKRIVRPAVWAANQRLEQITRRG